MWLCASCGLAQLVSDPGTPEEPKAIEPAALVAQAASAVDMVAADGWLRGRSSVVEFGSPHGGSWLDLLADRGVTPAAAGEQAAVVLDCFGLMHADDQRAAMTERLARVAPDGLLLLQYHSLCTILRLRQWTSLRHGHFAYYSTGALHTMLVDNGFTPCRAWCFDLYGGTVLLAARRKPPGSTGRPSIPLDPSVQRLLDEERQLGIGDPEAMERLQEQVDRDAMAVQGWLTAQRADGATVVGYGAASRAVALLLRAGVTSRLLPAILDASPAKQGRRMPNTDIPIRDPAELRSTPPDSVLLMLPDLLEEVRSGFPEVERAGGRWVNVETLDPRV